MGKASGPAAPTEAEAYAVQAATASASRASVAGWKVALVQGRPVAAPLFGASVLASGAAFDLQGLRGIKLETELAFTLRHDLRPGPVSREDIEAAIASMHAAFEVVGPRGGEPPAIPFTAFLADNLGNTATVVGPGAALAALPGRGRLFRNGSLVAEGAHPLHDPLAALLAYAQLQPDTLGGLRGGHVIITGSFTGVTPVEQAARFRGEFDGLAPVELTFLHEMRG